VSLRLPQHPARLWTLLSASSLTVMAGATIAPALGLMSRAFPDADPLWVKLVLTLPGLFTAAAAPLAARWANRAGRRPVLLAGLLLYVLAGTQGLWAASLPLLLAGRALLGAAVGLIMTCSTTLVLEYWEGDEQRAALGWQNAFMSFGGVVFQLAGGTLAEALGWRGPFWVYAAPLPLLAAAWWWLPEPAADRHAQRGGPAPLPTPTGMRGFLALLGILAFYHMVVFYYTPVQTPFLLLEMGVSAPRSVALVVGSATLFAGLASLQYARLRRRMAVGPLFALAFSLVGAGYAIVFLQGGLFAVIAGLGLASVGFGWARPNFTAWLHAHVPGPQRASAVAVMSSSIFLGQFCTPFLSAPLIKAVGLPGAYLASGGTLSLIGFWLWRRERRARGSLGTEGRQG
jgi:MFS family permease